MIDAYVESPYGELTLAAIKDYLFSKGGTVKYSELFDYFRDQIFDSSTGWLHPSFFVL